MRYFRDPAKNTSYHHVDPLLMVCVVLSFEIIDLTVDVDRFKVQTAAVVTRNCQVAARFPVIDLEEEKDRLILNEIAKTTADADCKHITLK